MAGLVAVGADEDYQVIVNVANPLSSVKRVDLSRLFLKKTTRWPNGVAVLPVDLSMVSPLRGRFTREIHGRSLDAILAYWRQQLFSGGEEPPLVRPESEVIAFVRANPGAIAYVSAAANLSTGVKALKVESGN